MKKHFGFVRYLSFALAATLCMPMHAMWLRTASQKVAAATMKAVTDSSLADAARYLRRSATTLGSATKNLQKAIAMPEVLPRGVRPLPNHWQTITALKNAQAAQPLSTMARVLQMSQKVVASTTAIGTGIAAAYGVDYITAKPEIRELKKKLTVENFNVNGVELYRENLNNLVACQLILDFIAQNITKIDPSIVGEICLHTPNDSREKLRNLVEYATKNFTTIHLGMLHLLLDIFPDAFQLFVGLAKKNFETINSDLFCFIIQKDPKVVDQFTELAAQQITTTPGKILSIILTYDPAAKKRFSQEKNRLKNFLSEELRQSDPVAFFDKLPLYSKISDDDSLEKTYKESRTLTITERFILFYLNAEDSVFYDRKKMKNVPEWFLKEVPFGKSISFDLRSHSHDGPFIKQPFLRSLVNTVITLERSASQQNMYTFVHGQQWQHFLSEKIFTDVWNMHYESHAKGFLFAHVRARDSKVREDEDYETLMHPKKYNYKDYIEKKGGELSTSEQRLLFLNAPFFANTTDWGESTASFFLKNFNEIKNIVSLKRVFDIYHDTDIYERHQQELDSLQQEYNSLSNGYGNILFFAIPKKLAKDYIFLAATAGYHKKIKINGVETDDIDIIMDAYQHHPETMSEVNRNEFCLIMCKEAMNPESGIKVKAINAADPEKMQKFWKKYDRIMDNIKADVQAKMAGKLLPQAQEITSVFDRYQELFAQA